MPAVSRSGALDSVPSRSTRRKSAIVQSGQRIGDGIPLQFLEIVIFENNRHAHQTGRRQHIHQNRFQRNRSSELLREFRRRVTHLFPQMQALRFAKIEMCGGCENSAVEIGCAQEFPCCRACQQAARERNLPRANAGPLGRRRGWAWPGYPKSLPLPAGAGGKHS